MKAVKMSLNTESGREAIAAKLEEVQKRSKVRTVSLEYITKKLFDVECRIGIPKSKLTGCEVHYTGAERFASAYKYRPESTHFEAKYTGKTWVVTAIYRDTCPNNTKCTIITLTDEGKAALIDRVCVMDD